MNMESMRLPLCSLFTVVMFVGISSSAEAACGPGQCPSGSTLTNGCYVDGQNHCNGTWACYSSLGAKVAGGKCKNGSQAVSGPTKAGGDEGIGTLPDSAGSDPVCEPEIELSSPWLTR